MFLPFLHTCQKGTQSWVLAKALKSSTLSLSIDFGSWWAGHCVCCRGTQTLEYSAKLSDLTVLKYISKRTYSWTKERRALMASKYYQCMKGSMTQTVGSEPYKASTFLQVSRISTSFLANSEPLSRASKMRTDLSWFIGIHITANQVLTGHHVHAQVHGPEQGLQTKEQQRSHSFSIERSFLESPHLL